MIMSNEFKTPWRVIPNNYDSGFKIEDAEGSRVADDGSAADEYDQTMSIETAGRIVACVNACAGIETGELEVCPGYKSAIKGFHEQRKLVIEARSQRDELLAALEQPLTDDEFGLIYNNDREDNWCGHDVTCDAMQNIFRRVLSARVAKAKGGAASSGTA